MNSDFAKLQKQFRGQKTVIPENKVSGQSRYRYVTPGKHTGTIILSTADRECKIPSLARRLCHRLEIEIETPGEDNGAVMSPYPQDLESPDMSGAIQCATNLQRILGDVIPGKTTPSGFEPDWRAFFGVAEDLIHQCQGERVEITVQDAKSGKTRDDGTPYQVTYINRGLGSDSSGYAKGKAQSGEAKRVTEDDLDMSPKKKTARKKVAKKKVRKRS